MPAPTARRAMGQQRRALLCAFVALLLVYAGYAVWRASAWHSGGRRPVKNARAEHALAPSVPPVQVPDDRRSGLPAHGDALGAVISSPVPTLPHTTKTPENAPLPSAPSPPALEPAVKTVDSFVAVCAATRSRSAWTTLDASDPVRILLPSLARTTTAADNVRVFLGANADDAFWGPDRAQELARHARTAWALDVALLQYAHAPNHIPFNALMRDAFDAGAAFLVRVNDDTEFVTPGWVRLGVDALAAFEPPNVGVVGPVCREGNTEILTHDMVHRTHLTIFDTYYPPEFSNWYVDDWISRVYGAARTRRHEGWVVRHRLTPMRYNPEERERALLNQLVQMGAAQVQRSTKQSQNIAPKYAIFTASDASHLQGYERNLNTMRCYADRHPDYEIAIFSEQNLDLQRGCHPNRMKFMRHCMLSNFLSSIPDIEAVLVLDSDNAIINLEKRFEEYAVTDLNFEIRFHNGEIAGGGFIVRNTNYTIAFTKDWSNTEHGLFPGDNGAMHQVILTRMGVGDRCLKGSDTYDQFRKCFVRVIHERNCDYDFFHQHASVLFPLHTYSYDGWLTKYRYSDRTFIHHAMKNPPIAGNNEGRLMPDVLQHDCNLIKSKDNYYISVQEEEKILQTQLIAAERHNWVKGGMSMKSCLNKRINSHAHAMQLTQPAHTSQLVGNPMMVHKNGTGQKKNTLHDAMAADLELRVIVMTMHRVQSLQRLFQSLQHADYDGNVAHLDIWIDVQENLVPNAKVLKACKEVDWKPGVKTIHVHSEPHGLRGQWFKTYSMSVAKNKRKRTREVVVLFEDDVEVSQLYWKWLKTVHNEYAEKSEIAGFSLCRLNLCSGFCPPMNGGPAVGNSVFLHPIVGTTGFSPTVKHWDAFTQWALEFEKHEHLIKPYVDGIVQTSWYKSFERSQRCPGRQCFWEMLHIYYGTTHSDK